MIRLALAIGFLAVFGIVTYVISQLLVNYFKTKNKQNHESNSKSKKSVKP